MIEYIDLPDFLILVEATTGIDIETLIQTTQISLAESALESPKAAFGGTEFYPDFVEKAAVLCAHVAWNHPLLDGNKRAAWICLREFCERNGYTIQREVDDAATTIEKLAAREIDVPELASWIRRHLLKQ